MIKRNIHKTHATFGHGMLGIGISTDGTSIIIQELRKEVLVQGATIDTKDIDLHVPPIVLTFMNGSGIDLMIATLERIRANTPKKLMETASTAPDMQPNVIKFKPSKKGN